VQIKIPKSHGGEDQHRTGSEDVKQAICVESALGYLRGGHRSRKGHRFLRTFRNKKLGLWDV